MNRQPRPDDDPAPVPGLERLPMEREPARDLWPGVEARLLRRAPRAAWPMALAAALVAGVAALLMLVARTPTGAPRATTEAALTAPAAEVAALPLRAENRALVKAHLQMVADAQSQLRHALAREPDAPYLQRLLRSAGHRQRELRELLAPDERPSGAST